MYSGRLQPVYFILSLWDWYSFPFFFNISMVFYKNNDNVMQNVNH